MNDRNRWLLPEGIEESLPDEAAWLEHHRRTLLDMFSSWGYELVIPPLIEYLESLLVGPSDDLDLQTFKVTDQLTGRMMGIRADMTPQVARIDAHRLRQDAPARFCYLGTVLHTRPGGRDMTRSPLQLGAELYGHAGVDSDVEVICLMLEALRQVGIENICLDLGHVGVFEDMMEQAGLGEEQCRALQALLQQRALPEYGQLLAECSLAEAQRETLMALSDLSGDEDVIGQTRQMLEGTGGRAMEHIDYVEALSERIKQRIAGIRLHFDFAALSGYHYENGAVFAAYISGQGEQIARGGRYDMIGQVFGHSRPATGFSLDLKALAKISPLAQPSRHGIFAPCDEDPELHAAIDRLRKKGERVIRALQGQQGGAQAMRCNRVLEKKDHQWCVKEID